MVKWGQGPLSANPLPLVTLTGQQTVPVPEVAPEASVPQEIIGEQYLHHILHQK